MKRAVTIQDISCFGKCSITVALPLISAMGVECAVIPTAVLSTHTGGFKGYTFHDLSSDIPEITKHWRAEKLSFDGVYTGYLGSPSQAQMIEDFIDDFSPELRFIDPVMGDNGRLYAGFDKSIVTAMRKLCGKATVITPNLTEASLLLDEEYRESGTYDEEYIKNTLVRLTELGAECAAITGVRYSSCPDKQGVVGYNRTSGEYSSYFADDLPISCHGTGDVFASTMFASLMKGKTLEEAERIAVSMTVKCIRHTMDDSSHWYSVKFEECIPYLLEISK